jgi:TRAP-type uncharacterized transport system substrate-binding protein
MRPAFDIGHLPGSDAAARKKHQMSKAEAESGAILDRFLYFFQRDKRLRLGIGALLLGVLLFFAARSAYGLLPHHYELRLSGGEIVSNRHQLARLVSRAAQRRDLDLIVKPERDTIGALEAVSKGEVDVAFVQGGIDETFPNVDHVAMVTTEYVHLLVKPGLKNIADLRGQRVNLGPNPSASREIGLKILRFGGFQANADYVETNFAAEELLALPADRLPDAIFTIATAPSYLAEILVRERGYTMMEIVFPQSLALREGWAGIGKILAYTYDLAPAVPDRDISTVTVNMYLVANDKASPAAIERLLEVLYSPQISTAFHATLDEAQIATPSGYPMHDGTVLFRDRNSSILTPATWDKLRGIFGLVMTFGGVLIVLVKWFRGPAARPVFHDDELKAYLARVAGVERKLGEMESSQTLDRAALVEARDAMGQLRVTLLERSPDLKLEDPVLFDRCVECVRACHDRARELLAEVSS